MRVKVERPQSNSVVKFEGVKANSEFIRREKTDIIDECYAAHMQMFPVEGILK